MQSVFKTAFYGCSSIGRVAVSKTVGWGFESLLPCASASIQLSMEKVVAFLKDSYEEIKNKVTWPKYDELQKSSTLVLVASLIFAVLVGAVDFAFKNGMQAYYDFFR